MNKKLRKHVIESYLNRKDGFKWAGLMQYAQALLDSLDELQKNLDAPKFRKEYAQLALKEKMSYLEVACIELDPKQFRVNCAKLLDIYIRNGALSGPEKIDLMRNVNWSDLEDDTISLATIDPNEFFDVATWDLGKNEPDETFPVVLAGLLIGVVRCYLNLIGQGMTEYLSKTDEVSSADKPLCCPVCGSSASLSGVKENAESKAGTRELFCSCCGTVWPFERIRCGLCGQTNPDELTYVCADEDLGHGLHVCRECGGLLPTVFQDALKSDIDYDVEMVASIVVQALYNKAKQDERKTR